MALLPTQSESDVVGAILKARQSTHGEYSHFSEICQAMKAVIRRGGGWSGLTDVQRESVEMIIHKLTRIATGDPHHKDHWDDIGGYARLAGDRVLR